MRPPIAAPAAAARSAAKQTSIFAHARYVIGENHVTAFAFVLFMLIALCAVLGPAITPYDPLASDIVAKLSPPTVHHWFGTDDLGRDILSRVMVATRLDFGIAVFSVALVFALGGLSGVAAGFFGGWTDRIVGRIADTIMAFPLFVLAMGIVAALGNTVTNIVIATAIINFPLYARVARAEANVRRDAGFVQAARLSGNGEMRIALTQILPNVMPIMVVQMSLTMGYAILNAARACRSSGSACGRRPPNGGSWWRKAPATWCPANGGSRSFRAGAALMLAVFCFNLLGDGLRDIVDPQRRTCKARGRHVRDRHSQTCRALKPETPKSTPTTSRCSMSVTSRSSSRHAAASSVRSSTSASASPRARPSPSSASPVPASRSRPMR